MGNDHEECGGRLTPVPLVAPGPDRFDVVGRRMASWLRDCYGRGELVPVPEGIEQAAVGLACQLAMVAFMGEAPARSIRLATEIVPAVQSLGLLPPDGQLTLPDSQSATSRAIFRALDDIFAARDFLPPEPDEAVASVLKLLRRGIPAGKLPAALREPPEEDCRKATDVMRMHITPKKKAGGRDGRTVTPRGAATRFAEAFGLRRPKGV